MPITERPDIRAAAQWWADRLRSPRFDNGDQTHVGVVATMVAMLNHQSPTDEQVDRFRTALEGLLVDESIDAFERTRLSVDYRPDRVLSMALDAAGLPENLTTLPWKTRMWLEGGKVMAKEGYGAAVRTIYPQE